LELILVEILKTLVMRQIITGPHPARVESRYPARPIAYQYPSTNWESSAMRTMSDKMGTKALFTGAIAAAALTLAAMQPAAASVIYSDNFNDYSPGATGSQYQTGLTVGAFGNLPGWTASGANAVHAVELDPGNWAVMIWDNGGPGGNMITLQSPIAANTAGADYTVAFDGGPAVWADPSQQTMADDFINFTVLDALNNVVDSYDYTPGAWNGLETLSPASFTYAGDGVGGATIRVSFGQFDDQFSGALDNLTVSDVPEPATWALMLAGLLSFAGIAVVGRRKQASTDLTA
jgi:hypothetical protein